MLFELSHIDCRYSDGVLALDDLSLSIANGERLVIMGANGSGKSTLLRLLAGLLHHIEGSISFNGHELSERSLQSPGFRQQFRQSIGFVFQNADAQLFNATVFEEVAFGPRQLGMSEAEARARTLDVLSFLGIEHLAERPPFRLSGGEKRKVAIASVLSMNPQVLMFDEPFLGLDPRSQTWLIRTLQQLQAAGKTTIVATHTLDVARRIADRALILDEDHRLLASGPVAEILEDVVLLERANLVEATFAEASAR
ncbi:energy-coupling factor ABC transporter ATP-binding protein [Fimbriimonas ginsengisoli]|uniref:ATPase component NikO of energizing module of nickel ECF transporter n=1 Tax=Fimbriimonas ginsengisoli Gsoil 348 TaxID=661478 RepID=A0A068NPR7_FIMGI|nr:ABC transporter ATP-binding protein [Fimbriimonas ginsengisoli]AIE85377.1 ATPase component NikO of energizing module of nickel ECF transporter [Fimbriimonas ginsengisoli Gsoil 348]